MLLLGSAILTLGVAACDDGSVEGPYLKSIEIRGHERATIYYSQAVYVGPSTPGLLAAVSAPEMTTSAGPASLSIDPWEFVGSGSGKAADGTDCRVHFERLVKGGDPNVPHWEPTAEQRRKQATGELEIVRVSAGCPFKP